MKKVRVKLLHEVDIYIELLKEGFTSGEVNMLRKTYDTLIIPIRLNGS
jgi:hypothetical protein